MLPSRKGLHLRWRIFLPVLLIVGFVIVFETLWTVSFTTEQYSKHLEQQIWQTVNTIEQVLVNEYERKTSTVQQNAHILFKFFQHQKFTSGNKTYQAVVRNQFTHQFDTVTLREWFLNGNLLHGDTLFVDSMQKILHGTITIFQLTEKGFIRMSTNVRDSTGHRAINTYIPLDSEVAQHVLNKGYFKGRAFVVDQYYLTYYKILKKQEQPIGMIYYGIREKDISRLLHFMQQFNSIEQQLVYLYDKDNNIYVNKDVALPIHRHLLNSGLNIQQTEIRSRYRFQGNEYLFISKHFRPFDMYIAFHVNIDTLLKPYKKNVLKGTVIIAALSGISLVILLLYFTGERLKQFLLKYETIEQKIQQISQSLEQSEDRFQKLFDSVGEDIFVTDENEQIIEVNRAACETLGYSRHELLSMKITDIKSERYKDKVHENRRIIYERGSYTFDSEHVTKDSRIIQVEFTSKVVMYEGERLILSVVRNVSKQREIERKILSAVIQGEEKERQRLARDMHDGLGPLLATIKLYTNELISPTLSIDDKQQMLQQINNLIDEAMQTTRTISNNLVPHTIYQYGFINTINAFCERINNTGQIVIHFEHDTVQKRFDQNIELILYRITTELITNTLKHARAQNIYILFVQRENRLTLYFKDDGVGFDVDFVFSNENVGMGLKNIISRVRSINGKYEIVSSPGGGFTMKIEITI